MTTDPWPPEGTRVRIVDELDPHYQQVGFLRKAGETLHLVDWRCSEGKFRCWPVERHEIEVIDET